MADRVRRLALFAPLSLVLLPAACGGGDGGGDGDGKDAPLTKSQYIARADSVCGPPPPPATRAERRPGPGQAWYLARVASFRARALVLLRGLDPPEELKGRANAFLALSAQQVVAQAELARAHDSKQAIAIENAGLRLDQLTASRVRASTEIGFKRCAQPSSGAITTAGYLPADVTRPADAACETANRFTLTHLPRNNSLPELARGLALINPQQRKALVALRALEARADSPQFKRLNDLIERRLEIADRSLAAARAGGLQRYIQVSSGGEALYQQGLPLGWRLGLRVCGVASNLGV